MRDLVTAQPRDLRGDAARFDVEVFLREIAVETVTGEEDAILAGPDETNVVWTNNFYLYKAASTGKYTVIGWDRNEGYWRLPHELDHGGLRPPHPHARLILERPENLARFKELLQELLDGRARPRACSPASTSSRADPAPYAGRTLNPKRPSSYQTWLNETTELRAYLQQRNDGVRNQLP
jgi:hypothetical protein